MSNSRMNRRRAFTLLSLALCPSLAGMAVYGQGIGGAHLRPQHHEFVNKFLANLENGMHNYRIAVEKDCSDKEGLQEARGNVVWYSGVNRDFNFLAVYAGHTEEEAKKVLEKAQRSYPQANLRKVKVVLDFSDR